MNTPRASNMPDLNKNALPPALRDKDLSPTIIRKASYIAAHLLLNKNMTVVVVGAGEGTLSSLLAHIKPDAQFIGIDEDGHAVAKVRKEFKAPNLKFLKGDHNNLPFDTGSIDAIINADTLNKVYSSCRYNPLAVSECLTNHISVLKPDGVMVILTHEKASRDSFVMINLPRDAGTKDKELLLRFSEQAHPVETSDCRGFFIEEQPPRLPNTYLYKLPLHWAHEFVLYKYHEDTKDIDISQEFSFYSYKDYQRILNELGTRVLYAAPDWDPAQIEKLQQANLRLYWENGHPAPLPPTSFILVCQKIGQRKSLKISERRPINQAEFDHLKIEAYKDTCTGKVREYVSRDEKLSDILPYRLKEDGRIEVFLHFNAPTPLQNIVKRKGHNLANKTWSGHSIQALSIPVNVLSEAEKSGARALMACLKTYTGLKHELESDLASGPSFLISPDFINRFVETHFASVQAPKTKIEPEIWASQPGGFSNNGEVKGFDAHEIMEAIEVGYIPNMRLGVQIQKLLSMNKNNHSRRTAKPGQDLTPKTYPLDSSNVLNSNDIFNETAPNDSFVFKKARGRTGAIRLYKSTFVDSGYDQNTAIGLTSKQVEFALEEKNSINLVSILPLVKDELGNNFIGFETQQNPLAQKYYGQSGMISLPKLFMPFEMQNSFQIRSFIAQHFNAEPQDILALDGPYFADINISPRRLYNAVLTFSNGFKAPQSWRFMSLDDAYQNITQNCEDCFLWQIQEAYRRSL